MTTNESRELLALRVSAALTIVFAVSAGVVAVFSDSETMSFEGLAGMVDVVVALLAIFVVRRIHAPSNRRYPFGYAKYEPLMTGLEGVMLASVCLAALISAVQDIVHPDPVEGVWSVMGYSLASFLGSVAFGTWMRRVGRATGSKLLPAEASLWIVEGWMAFGVFAAFAGSEVLTRFYGFPYSAYVDPGVTIVLVVIFLYKPYEIVKESYVDLVDANPFHDSSSEIEQSAAACVERFRLKQVEWIKTRRAGRRMFVLVSFLADRNRPLHEMETVRQAVAAELARVDPQIDVQVLFSSG